MSMKRRKRNKKLRPSGQRAQKVRRQIPPRAETAGSPHWAVTGVLMASAAFAGLATPVFAQDSTATATNAQALTRPFHIPAGSLTDALAAFSRASGITVADPRGLLIDRQSVGVSGVFTDEAALRQILFGSGVTYRFTNSRAVRLEVVASSVTVDSATMLPTIAVQDVRPAEVSSPKYTEPLRDIPQSITVVPREVMEQQGATTLRDVVRNVPGLTVNAGEGGATPGDNFSLRGFSARSDIFVDGVRANGGYTRETFNVEQVEVTKGPASAYIGRGSTGGAINLVTKTPTLRRAYTGAVGVGTANYEQVTADLNQPLDQLGVAGSAVRLNASWQDAGVPGLDVVEKRSWGVAPSLAFGLGTSTQLTVEHLHAEQNNMPSYGVQSNNTDRPPPSVDTHHFFGLRQLDHERVNVDRGSAVLQHRFSEGLTLRNQTVWSDEDVDRIVTATNLDGTRRTPSHVTEDGALSNATVLAANFAAGKTRHAVNAGVEAVRENSRFASYRFSATPPATDVNNPDPNQAYTGQITIAPPRRDVTAHSLGAYAVETAQLGSQLELSAGLRWDRFDPTYRDSLGNELTPHTTSEAVSWRAGAVFKPTEEGSLYAAYGTSFNPSGERLAYDGTGTNGLEPEKNRSYEVGAKWDMFRDRLLLSGAVFRTEKTNARITDPNDPLGQTIILAGQQRVDGMEVGASGRLGSNMSVFAGYTFLDSEIRTGDPANVGLPLPNTPKHSLSVWTTYRLPWELELGAGGRHLSRRVTSATNSVPPYWAFDAEASYPLGSRVLLRLNLLNLTDATYYDSGRYWVPAAGRALRLTTSLTY